MSYPQQPWGHPQQWPQQPPPGWGQPPPGWGQPPPSPPPNRRTIGCGGALVLCCFLGIIGSALTRSAERQDAPPAPAATPQQPTTPEPPQDEPLRSYPDNDNGEVPALNRERQTALGNIEVPAPTGSVLAEDVAMELRRRIMGHCAGRLRQRSCPDWFILMVLQHLEVLRAPNGELSVRVATMIPRPSPGSHAVNICRAVRYELFRITNSMTAQVHVYQWDGQTLASSSVGGESCL